MKNLLASLTITSYLVGAFAFYAPSEALAFSLGSPEMIYREDLASIRVAEEPLELDVIMLQEGKIYTLSRQDRPDSLDLLDGWKVSLDAGSCGSGDLIVFNQAEDRRDSINIKRYRDEGMFTRFFGNCLLGGGLPVYKARALGTQYFAFYTASPGWVLFDKTSGKFISKVFVTRVNASSEIGVSKAGKVVMTYAASKDNIYELGGSTGGRIEFDIPVFSKKSLSIFKGESKNAFEIPGIIAY